jgi:hypothetical protein
MADRKAQAAALRNYDPSWRERIGNKVYDWAQALGAGKQAAERYRGVSEFGADFVPVAGDALGVDDAKRSFEAGSPWIGAGELGLAALGVVPVVGDAAQKLGKEGLDELVEALRAGTDTFSGIRRGDKPQGPGGETVWSDLSKTRHQVPVEAMSAGVTPTGDLLERTTITPEALQGSVLMPAVGDRTAAGGLLRSINNAELSQPVLLEGGPDFMRGAAQSADRSVWASGKPVIGRLSNQARNLAETTGKDVNMVYSGMGARSGDFSTMMSDALIGQIEASNIPSKLAKDFDADMLKIHPDWPGVNDSGLREYLFNDITGENRKDFVELVAMGKFQKEGMPDIGSTRFAISEPGLVGQPTGATGYAVSRVDPENTIVESPSVPHSTYDTQMRGQYLGGFDQSLPREAVFPDFYAARRAAGKPPSSDDRAFSMSNVSQTADQKWLDDIMAYLEENQLR